MKICFFFLCIPFLINAEVIWQSEKNNCSIVIQLSSDQTPLYKPIKLHADFICPPTFELDMGSLNAQLLRSTHFFSKKWMINDEVQTFSKFSEDGKRVQSLTVELVPLSRGNLLFSLLNISFKSIKENLESIQILTPVFEIDVQDQHDAVKDNFAPLIALEPQYPLYLSGQNRHTLYLDPNQLIAEQARNIQVLKEHEFPLFPLLILCGLVNLVWFGLKFMAKIKQKRLKESQEMLVSAQATDVLQNLKNSPEWQSPPYKALYLKLADFCVHYIEKFSDNEIYYFTFEELHRSIEKLPKLASPIKTDLLKLLNKAYYVKYANTQPSLEECQEAYKISMELTKLK